MPQNPRIIQIISQVNKSHVFEWIGRELKKNYTISFILLNESISPLESFLVQQGIAVKRIQYRGKKDFIPAFFKTLIFLFNERPSIVHAHLLDGQLIGLTAAWLAGVKKRIYTRHISTYHHMFHPGSVWMDKLCNRLANRIVSISKATDETLLRLENVPVRKVVTIPHGFEFSGLMEVFPEKVKKVRERWKISSHRPVIGV